MASDAELLGLYLAEVDLYAPLDDEQEERLARLAAGGDEEAKHDLVKSRLRSAADLALRTAPPSFPPLDAIQEANLVLIKVVEQGFWGGRLTTELQRRLAQFFGRSR